VAPRTVDAIIPAGGAARRLGGIDKPGLDVAGVPLLDRVLGALDAVPLGTAVVVGTPRPTSRPAVWRREDPPGSGPVAAIAAALDAVTADQVLVLAADLPNVGPALPRLVAALEHAQAAVLVADGERNTLAAAWRTPRLRAALENVGDPAAVPVRRLYDGVTVAEVADLAGEARDCDTWADVALARETLAAQSGEGVR
jgi:molybdopterin-guanine dinucleotide biosynthesis protein A